MPLNILAWNNKIGPWNYFVGLRTKVMIIIGTVGGIRIPLSEVKFLDFWKTETHPHTAYRLLSTAIGENALLRAMRGYGIAR
jgi:hypothetical protein